MAEENNKPTFASIFVAQFTSASNSNLILKMNMWKGRLTFEFVEYSKAGGTPRKNAPLMFTLSQLGIIHSILSQIVMDRNNSYISGSDYREFPIIPIKNTFRDQNGNLRESGEIYIRTVEHQGKNRMAIGLSNNDGRQEILFFSEDVALMIDGTHPSVKAKVDLYDAEFVRFVLTIGEVIKNAILYNATNFLKDVIVGNPVGPRRTGGSSDSPRTPRRGPQSGSNSGSVDF